MFSEGTDDSGYPIMFADDLCIGKLIVDSGATRTVAVIRMFEDYYLFYHQHVGNAEAEFKPILGEPVVNFMFADCESKPTVVAVWMPICIGGLWSHAKVHVLDALVFCCLELKY